MDNDTAKEVVKQLKEIDKTLSMLWSCLLIIAVCVMSTALSQCGGFKTPVEVHVTNMPESLH